MSLKSAGGPFCGLVCGDGCAYAAGQLSVRSVGSSCARGRGGRHLLLTGGRLPPGIPCAIHTPCRHGLPKHTPQRRPRARLLRGDRWPACTDSAATVSGARRGRRWGPRCGSGPLLRGVWLRQGPRCLRDEGHLCARQEAALLSTQGPTHTAHEARKQNEIPVTTLRKDQSLQRFKPSSVRTEAG